MRHISSVFFTALFMFVSSTVFAGNYDNGEKLFKANCASCHNMKAKLTGPALGGVMDRVPSEEWLKSWIKNNAELRATGDAYANAIYNEYNGAPMTIFAWMSDEQLDDVTTYLKEWAPAEPAGAGGGSALLDCEAQVEEEDNTTLYVLLGVLLLSILIIAIFSGINRSLKSAKSVQAGGEELTPKSFYEAIAEYAVNNKKVFGLIVIAVVLTLAKLGWDFHMSIGNFGGGAAEFERTAGTENYHPTQPIHFKHDIHVTQNEIECTYCHSGALEGKHALIPSANVCMNCHKAVSEGHCPESGEEIKKIYEATGWDADKGKYLHADGKYYDVPREDKPIKWVKVHNLQDFVYFNHSQHVVVGGLDCENCHGDMGKMETAEQYAPLTMGWCINCHRETKINEKLAFSDKPNGYYEKMHDEFKEAYKHQKDWEFTVEKIGGLECAKCHY